MAGPLIPTDHSQNCLFTRLRRPDSVEKLETRLSWCDFQRRIEHLTQPKRTEGLGNPTKGGKRRLPEKMAIRTSYSTMYLGYPLPRPSFC